MTAYFLFCMFKVLRPLTFPINHSHDVFCVPSDQLSCAKMLQHRITQCAVSHCMTGAGGGIQFIQGRYSWHTFEFSLGSQLQPKIPVFKQCQILIKATDGRTAYCLHSKHHGMDRKIVLKLQQGPIKLALINVDPGVQIVVAWNECGAYIAVSCDQG